MVKFILQLYFACDLLEEDDLSDDEMDAIADADITKMMEMPSVPRIGEDILMGDYFTVTSVMHRISEHVAEVSCDVSLFQGVVAYAEDKEGWNMTHLRSGAELFYRRVKEFEEAQAKQQEDKVS